MRSVLRRADGPAAGNGVEMPSTEELYERTRRARDDFSAALGAAAYFARGWREVLRSHLEREPYSTLAVAVGIGYVLGGGVPTPLVRMLAGFGGRLALERALLHYASAGGREA